MQTYTLIQTHEKLQHIQDVKTDTKTSKIRIKIQFANLESC